MENQEENMLPPFWLQTSNTHQQTNLHCRRLRRSSSILFSSGALIIFLLVIAFAFIFIIIPTVQSFTSQIFKPQLVKKSWDSLNLILVLFAIVCGFLSRNTNIENNTSSYEGYRSVSNGSQHTQKSNPTTPHQWHQFSEHNGYHNKSFGRLRSSTSHPDLRQETFLVNRDERWRFYDDTHVTNFRHFDSDQLHYRRPWQEVDTDENLETKTIEIDTLLVKAKEEDSQTLTHPLPPRRTQSPPPNPPPPLPQTPPKLVKRKQRRTHQVIAQKEEIAKNPEIDDLEIKVETFQKPLPRYNSLPPPIVPLVYEVVHHKSSANKRSRGGAKEFLTSLNRRKKKKQRQKSVESFETILNKFYSSSASASASTPLTLHPPSSPPPPLPPPHSVFHNLFTSNNAKAKKLCLLSQAAPTPPPPKRPITQTVSKSKTHLSKPILEHKPRLPTKKYEHSRVVNDDNSPKSGSESSLIPIPPPPPPPFKLPKLKFVKHGDFVRLKSNTSSRCSSPDLDDDGEDSASDRAMSPSANGIGMEGRESPSPIFCSSPDVNTKADTFIARFRAGLKLEKVDSMEKQRRRVKSNLGPRSSLGQ